MNHAPRLLTRNHLERLTRGLRRRLEEGSQLIAQQLASLRDQLADTQRAADERGDTELARYQQQHVAAITDWDQQRMAVWDDAERRAYKAVHGVAAEENRLRTEARRQGDELTAEAKKRIADVERRFMRSKDKTIAKLNKAKEQIEQIAGALAVVQQEAATLLAQRSMTLNVDTASRTFSDAAPVTSVDAIDRCKQKIQTARQVLHWMAHNQISRSIESIWFWLVCGVCGAAIAGIIGATGLGPWLIAIVVGFITSIVMGLVAIVAVHPWIRRLIRAELPKLEGALSEGHALQKAAMHLALSENDTELRRLANKRDTRMQEAVLWRDNAAKELNAHVKQEMTRLRTYAAAERVAVKEQLTQSLRTIDQAGQTSQLDIETSFSAAQSQRLAQLDAQVEQFERDIERTEMQSEARVRAASQRAATWVARSRRWCQHHFPRWEQMADDQPWTQLLSHPVLPLGQAHIESLLPESVRIDAGGTITAPVNFEPFRDSYLTITADPASPLTAGFIQAIVLRALTTLPPGKTQLAVVDPQG
ncbi:MAG: hypothetical protein IT423_21525 [Pirellulaceae bacterium]|nr:hypothetical protein [Pirellulaceae bacterium]